MIKKFFLLVFLALFNISFASTSMFDKFEKKLQTYQTFKADIREKLYIEDFNDMDSYQGKLIINKRGEVLFRFTEPEKFFIYIDKDGYIYGYSYEDEEGYKKKLSDGEFYLKLFRRFLNKKSLKALFNDIREYKKGNNYVFVLIPKDKEIKKVILETDKNLNIKKIELLTEDGKVIYSFLNVQYLKNSEVIPNDIKKIIKKQ